MGKELLADVAWQSLNCYGEPVCGDTFVWRTAGRGSRSVGVLSDGMGHGIKAGILSNYTATMLSRFVSDGHDTAITAPMLSAMLPVCNVRGANYSTFTVIDIDHTRGEVFLACYGNPAPFIIRNGRAVKPGWEEIRIGDGPDHISVMQTARVILEQGDILVATSDGITQSGQKQEKFRFGWGYENLLQTAEYTVGTNPGINPADLCSLVVKQASLNDSGMPSDDITCAAIRLRKPLELMLVSCPPSSRELDRLLADTIRGFDGTKVICGYPVARIISAQMGLAATEIYAGGDPLRTERYRIPGFAMVTEGLLVTNRVLDILGNEESSPGGDTIPDRLSRRLLEYDRIKMVIGMRRRSADGDPTADEFELRRNILRRIISLLREKYSKQVQVTYI